MQIAFDEKYQSQFNVMQAELANQFTMLQAERDKMKRDWRDLTNSKDKEIEILKLKLLDAQKALDKVSRPGSSNDVPVNVVSATGIVRLLKKMALSHLSGQVAAMEAIKATLAIPGAPDSQLVMRRRIIIIIMINRTPVIRGAPKILIPQTTLGMPIPLPPSR